MSAFNSSSDCAVLAKWQPGLFANNCCSVTKCNKEGAVELISLSTYHLTGPIPTELGLLTSLTRIYLATNQLNGSIPTQLGLLSKLELIQFNNNQLSGTIPTELGRLSSLTEINLAGNQLTGPVPTEISALPRLKTLLLDSNTPNSSIPCNFTSCSPETNEPKQANPSSGVLIGGVMGGFIFVGFVAATILWFRQKLVKKKSALAFEDRQPTITPSLRAYDPFSASSSSDSGSELTHGAKHFDGSESEGFLAAREDPHSSVSITLNESRSSASEKTSQPTTAEILYDTHPALQQQQLHNHASPICKATLPVEITSEIKSTQLGIKMAAFPQFQPLTHTAEYTANSQQFPHPNARRPDDPKHWNQYETAEWIRERLGNIKVSETVLRNMMGGSGQEVTGRVLLILQRADFNELGFDTIWDQVVFEEAVAELRVQSVQQSALAYEKPPLYE
ncbi:hypothetical protein BJ741DRAFT_644610 [Chytriomyces cf. hyalinus JEL632]|nr:hypothetical protein BJ741DRAFT_644610 [Chytriomyces cf. hyalinus JEL632]